MLTGLILICEPVLGPYCAPLIQKKKKQSTRNGEQRFLPFFWRFQRQWRPRSVERSAQLSIANRQCLCHRSGLGILSRRHSADKIRWGGRAVRLVWVLHARSAIQAQAPFLSQSEEKKRRCRCKVGVWFGWAWFFGRFTMVMQRCCFADCLICNSISCWILFDQS